MRTYIGTKIVQAEAMSEGRAAREGYLRERNADQPGEGRPGYAVVYEDGYRSWSPREAFERAYRPVTPREAELVITGDG